MNFKNPILTILFIVALYYLSTCSILSDSLENNAKEYFLKECIGVKSEGISDFLKNNKMDFKLVSKLKEGNKYDFHYQAEIAFLEKNPSDDYTYDYEGIITFIEDEKGLTPQNATVFSQKCRGQFQGD
jgi:hypothetical protein